MEVVIDKILDAVTDDPEGIEVTLEEIPTVGFMKRLNEVSNHRGMVIETKFNPPKILYVRALLI